MSTLRERIAALQQRSSSPSTQQSVSAKFLSSNEGKSLKDKIATFEKRGGTPIPRSSFGLAPPSQGKPSSREMYGNRFTSTSTPLDPSMTRSNSTRSISPVPNPKRERRVSSYGDSSWGGPIRHQRSFSTAGDNLVPMHTGTTSSDEVSSITSSFPATPRDGNSSFLKFNEVFQEDPGDNSIPSVSEDVLSSLPPRDMPSPNFDTFRKAYGKFSSMDETHVPAPSSERSVTPLPNDSDAKNAENGLLPPDIVVSGMPETGTSTITGSVPGLSMSARPISPARSSFPRPVGDAQQTPTGERDATAHKSADGTAEMRSLRTSHSRKTSESGSYVIAQNPGTSFVEPAEEISLQDTTFPNGVETHSSSSPPLRLQQSQSSLRKLSPLKPPHRPISASLSTPEIMAQFPPVPFSVTPTSSDNPTAQTSTKATTPHLSSNTANNANANANGMTPASNTTSAPAKKSNPKNSIPGWWDYNSDDEQEGGWATVIVSTRNS